MKIIEVNSITNLCFNFFILFVIFFGKQLTVAKQHVELEEATKDTNIWRRLSATFDLFTNETVRTYNGDIPLVSCPKGYYRPTSNLRSIETHYGAAKSSNIFLKMDRQKVDPTYKGTVGSYGNRYDGCVACPRGRYGDTSGLLTKFCTADCPGM